MNTDVCASNISEWEHPIPLAIIEVQPVLVKALIAYLCNRYQRSLLNQIQRYRLTSFECCVGRCLFCAYTIFGIFTADQVAAFIDPDDTIRFIRILIDHYQNHALHGQVIARTNTRYIVVGEDCRIVAAYHNLVCHVVDQHTKVAGVVPAAKSFTIRVVCNFRHVVAIECQAEIIPFSLGFICMIIGVESRLLDAGTSRWDV